MLDLLEIFKSTVLGYEEQLLNICWKISNKQIVKLCFMQQMIAPCSFGKSVVA